MISSMTSPQLSLIPADNYLANLITAIDHASKRVTIVTMLLRVDSSQLQRLTQSLCDAASRGIDVCVLADCFTYLEPTGAWQHIVKSQSLKAYQSLETERQLKKAGVRFRWLGRYTCIGIIGRTHTKWSIVDGTVFSFGGVNISDASMKNTDYTMQLTDTSLAQWLDERTQDLIRSDRANHPTRNRTYRLNEHSTILFDGGISMNSGIYRRAIALAKQAQSIVFVSQYCPSGQLGRILQQKNARVYFNRVEKTDGLNRLVVTYGTRASKLSSAYHRSQYLHAKCMIFTLSNGAKIALTGSHNFAASGVLLGTREICLETADPEIIAQLETFIAHHVA